MGTDANELSGPIEPATVLPYQSSQYKGDSK